MSALICGSLAFDTITTFPGRFAQQILPEQLHILNVSFLVPTLRREFGGCAGNIAYTLRQLGGEPRRDGRGRQRRRTSTSSACASWGATPTRCARSPDTLHRAGHHHHRPRQQPDHRLPPRRDAVGARDRRCRRDADMRLAIIAPDGRDAMLQHAAQLAAAKIPFVFDPGPGPADVRRRRTAALRRAGELGRRQRLRSAACCASAPGASLETLSRSHLRGVIVTLGARRLRGLGAGRAHRMCPASRRARLSTRPAAAMPSGRACCTGWSAAGPCSAAPSSATASARSRSRAAAARIMCWIARRWACRSGRLKFRAALPKTSDHGYASLADLCPGRRGRSASPPGWPAAGGTGASSTRPDLRLDKTDKARLFSIQQTLQARKQIEALQKDLDRSRRRCRKRRSSTSARATSSRR